MGKIGDIWVRLGLKKEGFDTGVDDAKKKVGGLGASAKEAGAVFGSAFKGMAGAVGIAVGGLETFNRIVTANETNNDKWENTVRAMQNTVSEFFSALTSGDFSLFTSGLDTIIQKARDTADALRQIEDTQTLYGYFGGKNNLAFREQLNILRDKSLSDEARAAAKQQAESLIADQKILAATYRQRADNAVAQVIAQRSDISAAEISKQDVEHIMSVMLDASFETQDQEYTAAYKEYSRQLRQLQKLLSGAESRYRQTGSVSAAFDIEKYKGQIEELGAKYFDARLYNALWNKTSGDDLKTIVGLYQSADSASLAIQAMISSLLRYSTLITEESTVTGTGTGTVTTTGTPASEGSIAWYEAEISRLQKELENTTDHGVRVAAQRTINQYEAEISRLQAQVSRSLRPDWIGIGEVTSLQMPAYAESTSTGGGLAVPEVDTVDMTSGMQDYTSSIYESANALGVLGGAVSNITALVDGGAASWISYGANILQTVAQAIPAIASLTSAKNAEATANTASMVTGAGSSVASIPYVGPIMAVAAIANVLAAIANLPKFATGGIVGGHSFYGDKILARLNSGEMVLSQAQQASLYGALDRPVQDVHLTGQFGVSGRDLRLTIDKYDTYRRQ